MSLKIYGGTSGHFFETSAVIILKNKEPMQFKSALLNSQKLIPNQ